MQKMPYFCGLKYDVTTPINHFYGRIINLKCYNYVKILNTFYISDNRCSLVSRLLSLHVFLLPITSQICHYHRAKISSRQLFYEYVSLKLWRQNYCSSNAVLIKKYCWMVSSFFRQVSIFVIWFESRQPKNSFYNKKVDIAAAPMAW